MAQRALCKQVLGHQTGEYHADRAWIETRGPYQAITAQGEM